MNPKFLELLKKKKESGHGMSENEQKAKSSVVQGMRDMAAGMMGDKLKGLKKVSVASNSPEGLEEGLDKAKDLIGHGSDELGDAGDSHELSDAESGDDRGDSEFSGDGSPDLDGDEPGMSEHEEPSEHDGLSEEELDAKLQSLMKQKAKLRK